jgi:response regulator RpfG family c-di-GMP phosphodiesterase
MMNTGKILFVDDDPNLLAAFSRTLRKQFSFDTALGGVEAFEFLKTRGPYALAVVDMRMPGMDGIEVLEGIRVQSPNTVRMMLTGNADQQTAIDAVNRGQVFRFLNKPAPPEVLVPALEAGLERHELLRIERELLEGTLAGSIKMLTDVLGLAAPDALGRGQRLRDSIVQLARHLKMGPIWELELGALLSAIGCAAIPPSILVKNAAGTPLFTAEAGLLRRVPKIGHDLIADIPRLAGVADIVLYQQKEFNGGGFPEDSVSGAAIPPGARLLKILQDRLDLEADGVVKQRAYEVMRARVGVYDPTLLTECFACFPDFLVNALAAKHPVLRRATCDLVPGQVVVSDVVTRDGATLLTAGYRLTAAIIQRLSNFAELGEVKEPLLVQDPVPEETAAAATSAAA